MALGTWNIWELNVGPETQTGNFTWSLRFLKRGPQDNQISLTFHHQVPLMWVTSTSNAFTGRYLAPIVLVERCKLSQHSLGAVSRFQQAVRPHPPPTEDFMWLNLWQVIPRYAYSLVHIWSSSLMMHHNVLTSPIVAELFSSQEKENGEDGEEEDETMVPHSSWGPDLQRQRCSCY